MSQNSIPLLTLPLTLTGSVSANRFVQVDGTVAGAGENTLGVSRSAGVSGDTIAVDVLGTATLEAGGAIGKGDTLKSDSTGRGVTWASSGAKVALALEAASGAGVLIEVLLIPNVA